MFEQKGYVKVNFHDNPDIFIINTCSVTDNADKKCRKIVREARAISPIGFICIMGCYAQLKPKEIASIEGVDAVLGAAEKFRLLDLIDTFERPQQTQVYASDISEANNFHASFSANDRTRTFLKVQDGCNYGCAFCTIPLARGRSRSSTIEEIVETAKQLADTDTREIVITGVNTGDFGIVDGKRKERFIDLLQQLDGIQGIDRFRISSVEPNLLDTEIIDFVNTSERFVPHFHIPLQSGSDAVLKRMNRRYLSDLYASRVSYIKETMPHACIGGDVIVGFPGESEEEFLETYTFLNELDISYLHVFSFSERANTLAASMPDPVPMKERTRRSKMLRILSEKKRRFFYEQHLGSIHQVLFENDVEDGYMHGYTENYIRVKARYDPMHINEIKDVHLHAISANGLVDVLEPEMVF